MVGPESESEQMSEFAPSERHRLGFGIYKYIGFAKSDSPVYMLAKNTTSRIAVILKDSNGFWVGWVNDFMLETTVSCNKISIIFALNEIFTM